MLIIIGWKGFNNRIWSRSLRLRGFPAMYERYEVKADKKKFLEFNDCESQNDIIKGVWFELGGKFYYK